MKLKAEVRVKRVPVDIEDGAGLGYMQPAPLDGSRPATYYVNLKSTELWPRYQLATLTAREINPRAKITVKLVASSGVGTIAAGVAKGHAEHDMAFMKLPVVWWCFGFFLLSTMTLAVVQSFAVSILKAMHGVSFEAATYTITELAQEFDITARAKQTNYTKLADDLYENSYEVEVKNAKKEKITVDLREAFPGEWKMTDESQKHEKLDSNTAQWLVDVPAEGSTVVKYTVRIKL